MTKRQVLGAAQLMALFMLATPAQAHSVATGLEGFPAHLLHPVLTLHQFLSVIVVCVLASHSWPGSALRGVAAFALGIGAGWGMQYFLPDGLPSFWIVTYFVLLTGAVAATLGVGAWTIPSMLAIALVGAVFGLDNYNLDPSLWERLQPPIAIIITVSVFMLLLGWVLSRNWPAWLVLTVRAATACIGLYALVMLITELRI